MLRRHYPLFIASLLSIGSIAGAQSSIPTTAADVGPWDVAIVQRAARLIGSPAQWNHADTAACRADAKTFSIICALQKAVEEGAGIYRDQRKAGAVAQSPAPLVNCRFHPLESNREGSCGVLFDEMPIFTLSRVPAITSGVWRTDLRPVEVWSGTMADAEGPVMYEARQAIGAVSTKKYPARLVGYNNDSSTRFADVQAYFRVVEDRVRANGGADLTQSWDSVEVEIYPGGTGVVRTYNGWFPVTGFSATDSGLRFQIDTAKEVPPSALDREILRRAATIITSDAVWNRADDRKCPTTATTWSIYCAVERAEIEVTGGFHHRRPAMELVREIVDERTKTKSYQHRLMEYNNDPATHLDDVRTLFAEAIARIK